MVLGRYVTSKLAVPLAGTIRVGFPVKKPEHAALLVLIVGLIAHSRSSVLWMATYWVVGFLTTVEKASSWVSEPS